MSFERGLNRQDFARLLEKAYELEEAGIAGSGYALRDIEHATTAVGLLPGSADPGLAGFAKAREGRLTEWLISRARLSKTTEFDVRLTAGAMERLARLLEVALGGAPLTPGPSELVVETDDGVRIEVRARRKSTRTTVSSDHVSGVVGAAIGASSFAIAGALVIAKAFGVASSYEIFAATGAGLAVGYLSLRLYLRTAGANWRHGLDDVSAVVGRCVARAGVDHSESPPQ